MQHSFPVSIMVDYQATPDNRWQAGRWRVSGLVAGGQGEGVRQTPLHATAGQQQTLWTGFSVELHKTLWTGFSVELHKDEAESYYFNIVSDTPRTFVICTLDDNGPLRPLIVTLSYDEAASYLESDDIVESVAMPAELYRWVEQFVLENYLPQKKKKRKRENWKEANRERPPGL
jgi:hypothetical protein